MWYTNHVIGQEVKDIPSSFYSLGGGTLHTMYKLKVHSHMALPNNQSLYVGMVASISANTLSHSRGIRLFQCNYKNLLWRFSSTSSEITFTHVHCFFIYRAMTCWIIFVPSPNVLPLIYIIISFFCLLIKLLIAKTKSNKSQGLEATLLKVLHACLISRYRWEGWCLRLKTSVFKLATSFAN